MMDKNDEIINVHIPIIPILGVNIAAINMEWLLKFTQKNIKLLSGKYICVSNVHTTVMSYESDNYRSIQNGAVLAIPDGGPLSVIGRRKGKKQMKRTTGPDYMEEIMKISRENGWKHYFYGSTQDCINKLVETIENKYPGIQIVGTYSPPFRTLSEEEDKAVVNMINNLSPDFVWVGLGAPKQEKWMAEHKNRINGLMVGVGAAFDYVAGNIKRAPKWMQHSNLEWLYRLVQDPHRLAKRYFDTNIKFLWYVYVKKY